MPTAYEHLAVARRALRDQPPSRVAAVNKAVRDALSLIAAAMAELQKASHHAAAESATTQGG